MKDDELKKQEVVNAESEKQNIHKIVSLKILNYQ